MLSVWPPLNLISLSFPSSLSLLGQLLAIIFIFPPEIRLCYHRAVKNAFGLTDSSYSLTLHNNFGKYMILCNREGFIKKQMLKVKCSCHPFESLVHFERPMVN